MEFSTMILRTPPVSAVRSFGCGCSSRRRRLPTTLALTILTVLVGLVARRDVYTDAATTTTTVAPRSPFKVNMLWMGTARFVFYFNASTSLGALAYSMETFNGTSGVVFNKIEYRDSNCSSKTAIGRLFQVYEDGTFTPDFILGPICSPAMRPVALLGSYLNVPVFGWITSDPILNDKTQFTTLVRTLWPISNTAEGVIALCNLAKWSRVYIIATDSPDEGTLGDAVYAAITTKTNITVTSYVKDAVDVNPSLTDMQTILTKVTTEARIIILSVALTELRGWALAAYKANMYSGEYVFIYVNQQTATKDVNAELISTSLYIKGDTDDTNAQKALQSFFLVFAKTTTYKQTDAMLEKFRSLAYTTSLSAQLGVRPAQPDFYSLFLVDAVNVYTRFARAVGSGRDGKAIFRAAVSSVTTGNATGDIVLDQSADRTPDYYFYKMGSSGPFQVVAQTSRQSDNKQITTTITWLQTLVWADGKTGIENAPKDQPDCGFQNEKCADTLISIVVPIVVISVAAALAGVLGYCIRKMVRERNLANTAWKLNYDDIDFPHLMGHATGRRGAIIGSQMMRAVSTNLLNKSRVSVGADSMNGQVYIERGEYRGNPVAIKVIRKQRIVEDNKLREEMRIMLGMKHANLNAFIGASITPPHLCTVWEYCSKGSLQDVIYNDAIQLDDMFKFSICIDMLKGLEFIHNSRLKVHGRLKSNNVIVDGRWVCKLTDYGLVTLAEGQELENDSSEHSAYSKLYWTAPEVLRSVDVTSSNVRLDELRSTTQSADMYAVGITFKELFTKSSPYGEHEDLGPKDVICRVRDVEDASNPFRPHLSDLASSLQTSGRVVNKLSRLIKDLWSEDPKARPSCRHTLAIIIKINPSKNLNVMDNMIKMMDNYSRQLEETVEIRKKQLEEERKKTEMLLYRMLPRSIADKLKLGLEVEPESFDSVTIYFSDITGFQSLAVECSPFEVVDILNGVYGLFDSTIPKHDVYKVETIGDVYVMVSGLPQRNGDLHVTHVANCALELISRALSFRVPHRPNHKLRMRIGIHTGPIVASVVGLAMPRYCLFGDTMNTASRMESHGLPLRIHLSPTAKEAISKFAGYELTDRGQVNIKGKGVMNTYWLTGRAGYTDPLPDYHTEFLSDDPRPTRLPTTTGKLVEMKVLRPSVESGFAEVSEEDEEEESGEKVIATANSASKNKDTLTSLSLQ